jgi:UDP-3-O-[3-hydroxymyristoyl] glucosamine N-acyltransferase
MNRTVSSLEKLIGPQNCTIIGDVRRGFSRAEAIDRSKAGALTFCNMKSKEAIRLLKETKASVIICDAEVLSSKVRYRGKTLVAVDKPRLWFIRAINAFFPQENKAGIHPTVLIGKNCTIGSDVYIGPYSFVDGGVRIGSRTKIESGVHIHGRVRIGKNVKIKSGCIIGGDGFGYERNSDNVLEKFPHVGGVIIEDDVEIGSCTCVDRGTLSDTVIGRGTKIDNLVHIAHNVVTGKNCAIIAQSMIGGGAKIGEGAWISPTACIRDGIVVGKNSLVGMGAVVTKNVNDGDIVIGVPAKSIKETKK